MRGRIGGLLAALLLVAATASAQLLGNPQTVSTQDSGTACSVTLTCASFTQNVASAVTLTLQVSGTFTGTLSFEATADGSNWVAVIGVNVSTGAQVTTTTAVGAFAFANVGFVGIRVRATAAMTGSAFVAAARGAASARLLVPASSLAGTFASNALCLDNANTDACIQRAASGVFNLTAGVGGTTFTRVNFGTAIAGNPALKVSGAGLIARLADDSANATFQAGQITSGGGSFGFIISGRTNYSSSADKMGSILDSTGAIGTEINNGTPTLGVCTAGALTSGSHNIAGQYTGNTSSSCIINFGTPNFTNTPFCFAMSTASTTHPRISAASAASITVTGGVSGETIQYFCIGRIGV